MLWYKSWLETRWRFAIGLAVLIVSASGSVLFYPQAVQLLSQVPNLELSGEIGRRVAAATQLSSSYRGYIWSQWFVANMPELWIVFAVLLGAGGLLSQASGGGALFTLSLPVPRSRHASVRATTGLAELFILALVPSVWIAALSPAIGQSYNVTDALVHGVCLFVAGTVFFSLTFLLSTVFNDLWRPVLIVLCGAVLLALVEQFVRELAPYSLFGVMRADSYFRSGQMPWVGLLVTGGFSAAMLHTATRNLARQDF
jgi:hypothetical protein